MIYTKYLLIAGVMLTAMSSHAAFERVKNFFSGGRYYDNYNYHYSGKTSIADNNDHYLITIVMPGYNKEDVQVSATQKAININATGIKMEHRTHANRPITSFEQVVPLNKSIVPEKVQSEYLNGILTITAPFVDRTGAPEGVPVRVK